MLLLPYSLSIRRCLLHKSFLSTVIHIHSGLQPDGCLLCSELSPASEAIMVFANLMLSPNSYQVSKDYLKPASCYYSNVISISYAVYTKSCPPF